MEDEREALEWRGRGGSEGNLARRDEDVGKQNIENGGFGGGGRDGRSDGGGAGFVHI